MESSQRESMWSSIRCNVTAITYIPNILVGALSETDTKLNWILPCIRILGNLIGNKACPELAIQITEMLINHPNISLILVKSLEHERCAVRKESAYLIALMLCVSPGFSSSDICTNLVTTSLVRMVVIDLMEVKQEALRCLFNIAINQRYICS